MIENLYADPVDLGDELTAPARADLPYVRHALIRVRQIERETDKLAELRRAVVAEYDSRLAKLDRERDELREWVERYIAGPNGGEPVRFPDVGTAYLATKKPRPVVDDPAELEPWAVEHGFVRQTVDVNGALDHVKETGELPPGVKWTPEQKSLVIRG